MYSVLFISTDIFVNPTLVLLFNPFIDLARIGIKSLLAYNINPPTLALLVKVTLLPKFIYPVSNPPTMYKLLL